MYKRTMIACCLLITAPLIAQRSPMPVGSYTNTCSGCQWLDKGEGRKPRLLFRCFCKIKKDEYRDTQRSGKEVKLCKHGLKNDNGYLKCSD